MRKVSIGRNLSQANVSVEAVAALILFYAVNIWACSTLMTQLAMYVCNCSHCLIVFLRWRHRLFKGYGYFLTPSSLVCLYSACFILSLRREAEVKQGVARILTGKMFSSNRFVGFVSKCFYLFYTDQFPSFVIQQLYTWFSKEWRLLQHPFCLKFEKNTRGNKV